MTKELGWLSPLPPPPPPTHRVVMGSGVGLRSPMTTCTTHTHNTQQLARPNMQMAWSETPLCVLRTWGMEYGNIARASIALYVALGQLKHTTSGQQHAATTPKGHAGVSVHPPTAHTLTPTQSRTCSGARGRTMMPTIWWMPCSEGGAQTCTHSHFNGDTHRDDNSVDALGWGGALPTASWLAAYCWLPWQLTT